MSAVALPIVGPLVDGVVSTAKKNPVVDHLPKPLKALYDMALELAVEAAAIFAVALVIGGALYYNFPSLAAMFPRVLAGGNGYWGYVLAVLGGLTLAIFVRSILDHKNAKADVLSKDERAKALEFLTLPGLLVLLGWLITAYIA